MNTNAMGVKSEYLNLSKDRINLHPAVSMFDWSSAVFIDLAIQSTREISQ